MSRLGKLGWLVAGLAVAAAVAPGTAWSAAKSLVTITNGAGTQSAQVTKAGQLLASEFNPASTVVIHGRVTDEVCTPAYTVPNGKALVIKTAMFGLGHASTMTSADAFVFTTRGCANFSKIVAAATVEPPRAGTVYQPLDPGVVVPSGGTIRTLGSDADGLVTLYGYLVPAAAAPSGSLIIGPTRQPGGLHRDSP